MKSLKYIAFLFLASMSVSSCSDFLDKYPDERTDIDSEDKVVKLLSTSYPEANYAWLSELYGDNLLDNQAPHLPSSPNDKQIESYYNYPANEKFEDELFRFEPAASATYNDYESPGWVWNNYYRSISSTNFALQAIEKLKKDNGGVMSTKLQAAYGEAKLLRAYGHFILVNLFSQAFKSDDLSKADAGIPYVQDVENIVNKQYNRGSVTATYDSIQKDLEEGLKYASEVNYANRVKYHFNINAAHAFAARFYLYRHKWEKAIEHANAVLGTDSASVAKMGMDYSVFDSCSTADDYGVAWQQPGLNNNIMLLSTYSIIGRNCFGGRYSVAGEKSRAVLMVHQSPLWSGYILPPLAIVGAMAFSSSNNDYGFFNCKVNEQFQMTDKIKGTGYVHTMLRAFTGAELLLIRAEAEIMMKKYEDATRDLMYYWNNSINSFSDKNKVQYVDGKKISYLTPAIIKSYYGKTSNENCLADWSFVGTNVSPEAAIPADATALMNCLNDFRRFETAFEGLRLFDLKRWGFEWSHYVGTNRTEYKLKANDSRRAIELPWEAISAGMEPSHKQSSVIKPIEPTANTEGLKSDK